MNGKFKYKNKDYNVYTDTSVKLEFIFIDGEEQIFWDLLKKHGNVDAIPENEFLTGIYFHKGTLDLSPEYKNSSINARYITK